MSANKLPRIGKPQSLRLKVLNDIRNIPEDAPQKIKRWNAFEFDIAKRYVRSEAEIKFCVATKTNRGDYNLVWLSISRSKAKQFGTTATPFNVEIFDSSVGDVGGSVQSNRVLVVTGDPAQQSKAIITAAPLISSWVRLEGFQNRVEDLGDVGTPEFSDRAIKICGALTKGEVSVTSVLASDVPCSLSARLIESIPKVLDHTGGNILNSKGQLLEDNLQFVLESLIVRLFDHSVMIRFKEGFNESFYFIDVVRRTPFLLHS